MERRPVIVGLYGISGVGKTKTLDQLRHQLGNDAFLFLEGSDLLTEQVGGDLRMFQGLNEIGKQSCREQAVIYAAKQAHESSKAAIVAGHYTLWNEGSPSPESVWTEADEATFTHIVYFRVGGEAIARRREADTVKSRPKFSPEHLNQWQQEEIHQLRQICYRSGVLFTVIDSLDKRKLPTLLNNVQRHDQWYTMAQAEAALDDNFASATSDLETVLVFDGDKTLVPQDTGQMFFDKIPRLEHKLRDIFQSNAGYSYSSFRQAMLPCEEAADNRKFDALSEELAFASSIRPEIENLIHLALDHDNVSLLVLTCGLRVVFEKVLKRYNLHKHVKVIGGGRLSDGYVVMPELKRVLVRRLQEKLSLKVLAFGDSPLDLPMLKQADEAIVVVGDEHSRSRSMDAALRHAIEEDALRARQLLRPDSCRPRLNEELLPLVQPQDLAARVRLRQQLRIFHSTSQYAALLLSTPMRDANIAGSALREAHRLAGWYLATQFLSRVVGLEEYAVPHVQGHMATEYRIRNEAKTCIIPLMCGGEPMAFGVSDALPLATFVHAKQPEDIGAKQLEGISTVLLVDAVVNTGKSIVDFVHQVKHMNAGLRLIVVAGTVQKAAISECGSLTKPLEGHGGLSLVALRVSDNKFNGTKGTDTGNRLFNTTHLD